LCKGYSCQSYSSASRACGAQSFRLYVCGCYRHASVRPKQWSGCTSLPATNCSISLSRSCHRLAHASYPSRSGATTGKRLVCPAPCTYAACCTNVCTTAVTNTTSKITCSKRTAAGCNSIRVWDTACNRLCCCGKTGDPSQMGGQVCMHIGAGISRSFNWFK
jgi:hypothetical protein